MVNCCNISDKTNRPTKTFLKGNDKILSEDYKEVEESSSFLENTAKALNIKPKGFTLEDTSNLNNSVEVAHPSILTIKENVPVNHLPIIWT